MFTENTQVKTIDNNNSQKIASFDDSVEMFPTISDSVDLSGADLSQSYGLDSSIELQRNNSELDEDTDDNNFTGSETITNASDFIGNDDVDPTETFDLLGLSDLVIVDRDEYGIPHIEADNIYDGVLAQGFVEAQDRLWQMEYRRRFANGTLAEILGEDAVGTDTAIRTLGINRAAQIAYDNLAADSKAVVDAYADGVNAYLANTTELPPELAGLDYQPQEWLPTDTVAIAQFQNYLVGTTNGGELTRVELLTQGITPERIDELFPNDGEEETTILKSEQIARQEFAVEAPNTEEIAQTNELETQLLDDLIDLFPTVEASNNWVVSGDRTTTGKPFLANDPHLSLENPSAWYQTEIDTPEFGVIGASLPGVPGIQVGRNDNIAWGQTATQADTEDFYLLQETEDGTGYIYQGEVNDYKIREETIEVKDGETITLEVKESVYGALVSDVFGIEQPVANQAVGLEPVNGLVEAFFGISQASNWEEFTTALESVTNPNGNYVYADVEGNIGYIAPGNYPIRQPGHTGEYPVLGNGEFDWQGFIPPEDVPQLYNPESGYIVTANNRLTPDNYPYAINGNFAPSYRAERITELIEGKDELSIEDMQEIQFDRVSLLYRDFQPLIEQLSPDSERAEKWQQRLLDWDGNVLPDSQEASVFEAWYVELTRIPGEETGTDFWSEPRYLQQAVTSEDAATALDAALERLGTEIPVWGDIHSATFEPLVPELDTTEPLQVPLGGDRYTVNVSPNGSTDFNTSFGASYRQIIDFSDLNNSLYVNPPGQNSDPTSSNYSNQLELWQQGEYLPMTTDDYDVAERLLLQPLISLPEPMGEYQTGTATYYFTDPEREEIYTELDDNRELAVKVWYPIDADTGIPAPYISEELGAAISGLELPKDSSDIGQVLQSIPTNSILNAPVAETDTEYPVLLFSHGLGAFPEVHTIQAEALASEGYVVVSINHTYDSLVSVFPDGEVTPQTPVLAADEETDFNRDFLDIISQDVTVRAEDAQFVLDELSDLDAGDDPLGLFADKLDLDKVGILGHSLGGATAAETLALDNRFQAGINQDGGLYGSNAGASLIQPFMFLNADRTNAPADELPIFDLQQQFLDNLIGDGYDVSIAGTEHNSFTDLAFLISSLADAGIPTDVLEELSSLSEDIAIAPVRALNITNDYTTAFFDRYLKDGESSLLNDDAAKYSEVYVTTYPGIQTDIEEFIARIEDFIQRNISDLVLLGQSDKH